MINLKDKRGKFLILWIFVASFFFIFLIALIGPFKPFLEGAMSGLSCSTTDNTFILPVCWLMKGTIVLFIFIVLGGIIAWVRRRSE